MRRTLLLVVASAACGRAPAAGQPAPFLAGYDFGSPEARWEMPGRLAEVSGLALTPDGRLFAHDDERGRVHEIDTGTGEVGKRLDLQGDVRGDFEAIAVVGERFFLITSAGLLHEFREGADREEVAHRVTDTRLGARCEVEGLAHDPVEQTLLVACKRATPDRGVLVIHRLPLDPADGPVGAIEIATAALPPLGLDEDFQPSAILVTPVGTLLLASAVGEMLLEVDRDGRALHGVRLDPGRHPQTEGLALDGEGRLYLADEQNDQDAHVSVYAPRGGGGA